MRTSRLLILLALVAIAPAARASDVDQFGFGARAIALGNAYTALATDWSGTYYNPGALGGLDHFDMGAGFSYAAYHLKFSGANPSQDSSTERQQPLSALTIGIAAPLGDAGTLLNRVVPGLGLLLPTRQIVGVDVETGPGKSQFFLYGARRDKLAVLPALAFRVLPVDGVDQRLSIGIGATVLANLDGDFNFNLGTSSASSVGTKITLSYGVAPNFGLWWEPCAWLSFGIAYRGELSLKATLPVVIDLTGTGGSDFPLDIEAVTLFQPQQVQGGLAVFPLLPVGIDWVTLSFDLTWYNWSAFQDPFITIRPILAQTDPHLKDTVVPRFGLELEPVDGLAFRTGYYYQQTPIPAQTGDTTLVDNDKHVVSFGIGWTWHRMCEKLVQDGDVWRKKEAESTPLSIDGFVQWHHLVDQHVVKTNATASTVGGSFDAGGDIFYFGIQATLRF